MLLDEYKGRRGFANLAFQKWERSLDYDGHFVLANQQDPENYFLLANADKTMSVKNELSLSTTTPKQSTTITLKPSKKPPTGGADSKTIKISAIFIQLLLLAELLMM